ncbi:iron ABC transporter permease [Lysinibacillus sphaericus]|uniref:Ferrichrome ABC transporter permease n=1 Tax=Lysinibacillus sphaericus TaxID=1421 RepID=A0A2S0JVM6_LYSSH|nr:iron ABC transporter permease [Lysinibacillus sphaericus]AVK95128.1 ferrichrome ABC transporter permease [Lysinibacillus sphaericus]MED4544799.1 iron ABC transporter permease [Lysinibacillus sphaericus]TKI18237.1 iron ABC transporter permease [Lysinibacillus sphaericus]SUV19506.1 transport system permease protein [Lysinibacillus sphaericus]GEC83366.1 ferrichrome ABC transporter permease [Lysinibacillus sphaericus]
MKKTNIVSFSILVASPFLIVIVALMSIMYGTKDISALTVWQAITVFDPANIDHQIIRTSRMPRMCAVLLVGAFLAVAGAVMQGITRNYLASPSLMGVNDGSAFVITLAIVFFPGLPNYQMILLSMLGSALGAGIVFGFGSLIRDGLSPVRLAIIGTVIGTFLSSIATAIAMYFQVSQTVSAWYNTKVHMVDNSMLLLSIPFGLIGLMLALFSARAITITALGDDIAIGLGQKTKAVKMVSMLAVVCLTGTAVALVGKIAFVGLVIPHITRFLVGVDYRFIIPCAALIGAFFLALCDVLSRFVNYPFETPIGVLTALVGVPFFLYLVRKHGGEKRA